MIESIVNTICLLVLCACCTLYINNMSVTTPGCERWGFVLTAAGAFGHALGYWWPWGGANEVETILHIGIALIAVALMRGELRALLMRAAAWDGITDRRRRS
ncbi:MAG: hypothetical protein ACK50D_13265 [Burkholderiales bacterium]|jgi:hypothetical protein